jgi:hypothetical protein
VLVGRTVRGSVSKVMQTAHQYLLYRSQENEAKRLKEKVIAGAGGKGNTIKDYVAEHGEETAEGHIEWRFPEPLTIGGQTYAGFRNQRSQGEPLLDEDRTEKLLVELGLRDQIVREVTVEVWDWDMLYVLNQQGKITDEQLDSLFDEAEPSWSLTVIK